MKARGGIGMTTPAIKSSLLQAESCEACRRAIQLGNEMIAIISRGTCA